MTTPATFTGSRQPTAVPLAISGGPRYPPCALSSRFAPASLRGRAVAAAEAKGRGNGSACSTHSTDTARVRATYRRRRPTCSPRSEEHTSELQSRRELVCRLLLEKK